MLILRNDLLVPASHNEINKYHELNRHIRHNFGLHVFRGETTQTVYGLLNINNPDKGEAHLEALQKIFVLGAKANFYRAGEISGFISDNSEDISEEMFRKLFKLLNEVCRYPHKFGREVKKGVGLLKGGNPQFFGYFSDPREYLKIYKKIQTESDILKVIFRDYLFVVLHTLEVERFHSRSYLISTTLDPEKTKLFSGEKGLMYEYYIPKPYYRYAASFRAEQSFKRILERNHIPEVIRPIYETEQEYSVRRALLPHFLLCIHNRENNQIILNPAFAHVDKADLELVSRRGFIIDQSNFFKILKQTNYTAYGILQNGKWSQGR